MDQNELNSLYQQYLGRGVDASGAATWGGADYNTVVQGILGSQEYQNRQQQQQQPQQQQQQQPQQQVNAGGTDINSLYQQYLGRNVDASGAATYAGWNPQDIVNAILGSQEYKNRQGNANGVSPVAGPQYSNPSAPTTWDTDLIAYKSGNGQTYYAPSWLRPEDYVSSGFAPPYTQQEISGKINPDWYRSGAGGVTYASVKGPSDLSGGEFVIDTRTGTFAKDKNGNLIPVPRPNSPDAGWFNDWGVLAIPLLAAGGVTALEGLGALGAGAEATTAIGQALPYTEAFDAANLYANGITNATQIGDIIASTGMDPFIAADIGNLAAQGLSAEQIAQIIGSSYTAEELAGTGISSLLKSGGGLSSLLSKAGTAIKDATSGTFGDMAKGALLASALQAAGGGGTNIITTGGKGSNYSDVALPKLIKGNETPFIFSKEIPIQAQRQTGYNPFEALNIAQNVPGLPMNPYAKALRG